MAKEKNLSDQQTKELLANREKAEKQYELVSILVLTIQWLFKQFNYNKIDEEAPQKTTGIADRLYYQDVANRQEKYQL